MGDFNSRTGLKGDYIVVDHYFTEQFDLECIEDKSIEILNNFHVNNISLSRRNKDWIVNAYGNQMLYFCRNSNLFTLNGRVGDVEHNAKFTCKDKSTVDYFLSTSFLLDSLNIFVVLDFCSLLSDAHCPISINLEIDPEHQH